MDSSSRTRLESKYNLSYDNRNDRFQPTSDNTISRPDIGVPAAGDRVVILWNSSNSNFVALVSVADLTIGRRHAGPLSEPTELIGSRPVTDADPPVRSIDWDMAFSL